MNDQWVLCRRRSSFWICWCCDLNWSSFCLFCFWLLCFSILRFIYFGSWRGLKFLGCVSLYCFCLRKSSDSRLGLGIWGGLLLTFSRLFISCPGGGSGDWMRRFILSLLLDDIFLETFTCLWCLHWHPDGCLVFIVVELDGKRIDYLDINTSFLFTGIDSPLSHLFFPEDLLLFDGFDGWLCDLE